VDCITWASLSTWWEWLDGSRLFFWRWPEVWQREAQDGARGFHTGELPPRLRYPANKLGDEWTIAKDLKKLIGLIDKRYLKVGPCQNTVPRFPVTKAIKDNKVVDIRVIWDLRKSGYNAFTFTPKFQLPTASSYT